MKRKKNARYSTGGGGTTEQQTSHDETNILLNQETLDSPNNSDRRRSDDSSSDMSIALDPGRTRRYHRCFKINICLNIAMLLLFVCLITFGEWYKMLY